MYIVPHRGSTAAVATALPPLFVRPISGKLRMQRRCRPRPVRCWYPHPGFLGQLSIDPSVDALFPAVRTKAGFTAKDKQLYEQWVDSGFLPDYYKKTPGDCGTAATSLPGTLKAVPALSVTGSSLLKFAAATGPAAPFVAAAGAVASVLGDIFGIFGGHHAAAVAKEQDTLCQIVPAVNQALSLIDQALQQGQMTSAAASQALDNTYAAYTQAVSQIIKDNTSQCNAACVYGRALRGIVAQRKLNLKANPPVADTSPVAAAAAQAGLPSWAPYVIGGVLLWYLVS
jgi:phage tail protein X